MTPPFMKSHGSDVTCVLKFGHSKIRLVHSWSLAGPGSKADQRVGARIYSSLVYVRFH